jgi:hypothetical protein
MLPRVPRRFALVALLALATTMLGCPPHLPDMRAQAERLPLPGSYTFLGETSSGDYPTIFGRDTQLHRYYRSPLDLERTCDDLEAILRDRSPEVFRSDRMQEISPPNRTCTFGLKIPPGWLWRALGVSPYPVGYSANAAPSRVGQRHVLQHYPGEPLEAFTQVSVTLYDRYSR